MNTNLASVIIPTFNRAEFICKTLDSVWAQTYRPIEVVIVDDGSTDNTKITIDDWVKEHLDKAFKIVYIHQKNSGAPSARNKGIKNASGRYLQFLDSDDYLMPEKLALQIQKMQIEKTGICICDYYHTNEYGENTLYVSNDRSIEQIITEYRHLYTSIGVIDTSFFKPGFLKWNPKIKKAQDLDFYLKVFLIIDDFSYINKPLSKWIRHLDASITNTTTTFTVSGYFINLTSILKFHFKNRKLIQSHKKPCIKILYKKAIIAICSKTIIYKLFKSY